ncbi:UNVERIFIED_CONTAM: hypothetical protein Sangu_0134300 [Sesamum angustifolium]|uniref:Uncharacterized protein n=1 Tax=Sesamum angustifolium TaxID=2727405 RepID=A0AAW2RK18_9LAMI
MLYWKSKNKSTQIMRIAIGKKFKMEMLEMMRISFYSADATSHNRPTYEYLDAMAKAFNEDQEDGYEDELLSAADPLNEINLVNYLHESLAKFSESDKPFFQHLFQSLTKLSKMLSNWF